MGKGSKKLVQAYERANVTDVINGIKTMHNDTLEYLPTIGPLPKSTYTYDLEMITRRLMNNEKFQHRTIDGAAHIEFSAGETYNLTEILAHANLQHLTFTGSDFESYENYTRDHSKPKPNLPLPSNPTLPHYPTKEDFKDREEGYKDKVNLEHLSYAEKLAVNVYTTRYYTEVNSLLRGRYQFDTKSNSEIRDVIIHTAMCGQAINNIAPTTLEATFRYEKTPDDILKKRLEMVGGIGVSTDKGFTSTGEVPAASFKSSATAAILYNHLKGVFVAPLSEVPYENEFLIPPTQVRWDKHTVGADGMHYFVCSPAVDLKAVHDKANRNPNANANANAQITILLKEVMTTAKGLRAQIMSECDPDEIEKLFLSSELDTVEASAESVMAELSKGNVTSEDALQELENLWQNISRVAETSQVQQNLIQMEVEEKKERIQEILGSASLATPDEVRKPREKMDLDLVQKVIDKLIAQGKDTKNLRTIENFLKNPAATDEEKMIFLIHVSTDQANKNKLLHNPEAKNFFPNSSRLCE